MNRVTNPRIKMNKINQIKNLKNRTVKVIASGRNMNNPKKIAIARNIENTIKSLITLLLFLFYIKKIVDKFLKILYNSYIKKRGKQKNE